MCVFQGKDEECDKKSIHIEVRPNTIPMSWPSNMGENKLLSTRALGLCTGSESLSGALPYMGALALIGGWRGFSLD